MKEELRNKLTEDSARDILDFAWPMMTPDNVNMCINNLKQAGIIRQSAKEELKELVEKISKLPTYHDGMIKLPLETITTLVRLVNSISEASSISEEVKKAREKTDEYIETIKDIEYEIDSNDNYHRRHTSNIKLKQLLSADRQTK